MGLNSIRYSGGLAADATTHPSPIIWAKCPIDSIKEDPTQGVYIFEDFNRFGKSTAVASNVGRYVGDAGQWISYEDNSCTITQPVQGTPAPNSLTRFSITGSANKAAILELGYGTAYSSGSVGAFNYTDGVGGKLFFEARFQVSQIAANTNALFIGLAQSGVAVVPAAATSTTTLFDSASAVGNCDLIGFDCLPATPSTLRCVYGKNGSARTSKGTAQTLVASTFYKVGILIDPLAPYTVLSSGAAVRKKVRWFVNGLEVQYLSDTSTSPFPTAANLTPVIHVQTGSAGTALTADFDFIGAAQLYTS